MSKPLSTYMLPGAGVATLALGLGIGMANREYGSDKIEALEARLGTVEMQASEATAAATDEAAKASELEATVATLQAEFAARAAAGGSVSEPAPIAEAGYGIGRAALPEEIAAWDVDVLPGGRGLPEGSGDVWTGEEVFVEKCASCHGDFAEGVDNWPVLAGGFDTLADEDPVKTVGSYWPHLSTAWDYINRSMPFGEAGTLSADETYAIVAYILYSNDLVEDDFVLSRANFGDFQMHNMQGFVIDDRPEQEYAAWQGEPCMTACKEEVQVTMRTVFLVETPPEGGSNSVMNEARSEPLPSFTAAGPSFVPDVAQAVAQVAPAAAPAAPPEPAQDVVAGADPALIAAGEKVFKKCKACHQIGDGAQNKTGPALNNIIGAAFGSVEGFKYSKAFAAAQGEGRVWDEASMAEFLTKPKTYLKGTKMSFAGLKKEGDRLAIIAYLNSFRAE